MKNIFAVAAVTALLAACADEVPEEVVIVDPTPTDPDAVLALSRGDLDAATYNPDTNQLTVQLTFIGDNIQAAMDFDEANGDFDMFTFQETETDRFFTGAAATSDDGNITVVVASDGGRFNRFFGGAAVTQLNFEAPTGGLSSYEGQYVGILNFGPEEGSGAGGEESEPGGSLTIDGSIVVEADFNNSVVEGGIFGRVLNVDDNDANDIALPEIVLTVTDIQADGSFTGVAELGTALDLKAAGVYGGAFGGSGATSVGGWTQLDESIFTEIPVYEDLGGNVNEYGVFILNPRDRD